MVCGQIRKSCKPSPSKKYKSWQRFCKETRFWRHKVSIRDIKDIKVPLALVFLDMKTWRKTKSIYQENVVKKNMLICYW